MYKTIEFKKRFIGGSINTILNMLFIVNLVFLVIKKRTVGSLIAKYKYADRETGMQADIKKLIIYFFIRIGAFFYYVITLSVMYWVMLSKMKKEKATFGEKWSGIIKIEEAQEFISIEQQNEIDELKIKEQQELESRFIDTRKGEPALEVKNFTKHYKGRPNPAVSNASFKVYPGEFHGFIGANGAGKTTAIKSIIGAYANYEGVVEIFGNSNKTVDAKKDLGYIPEAANFPKKFTTLEYITHMSRLSGLSKKEAKERALKSLEDGNLMSIAKVSPNTLSSGQKKKVLLAQALVHEPKIVVMDEPAANLDPKARIEFFDTLRQIQKEKKSILISSHILAELDKYIDSVTILDGGKVVYSGLVKEITKNPNLTFRVNTSDNTKIITFLDKKKIVHKMSEGKSRVILADMLNSSNIMELQKFILSKNILIEEFKNNVITVEEVYENFVKFGSVDTGAGRKTPIKNINKNDIKEEKLSLQKVKKTEVKKGGK